VWQEGSQIFSESGHFGAHLHQAPNLMELLPLKDKTVFLRQARLLASYPSHMPSLSLFSNTRILKSFTQHSFINTLADHQPEGRKAEC